MITRKVGMNNFFVSEIFTDHSPAWGVLYGEKLIGRGQTVDEAINTAESNLQLQLRERAVENFMSLFGQIKKDIDTEPFQFQTMEWNDDENYSIEIISTGASLLLKASSNKVKCWGLVEIKHLGAIKTGLNKLKNAVRETLKKDKKTLAERLDTLEALRTTAGKIERSQNE